MRDVAEPVDLRRDVVVHEDRVAVPGRDAGVAALGRREGQVLLGAHPVRRAEADDLAGAVARPFVGVAVVRQAEVVGLSLRHELQRGKPRGVGHLVQVADLVLRSPDPSPALALGPLLHAGVLGIDGSAGEGEGGRSKQNSHKSFHRILPCRGERASRSRASLGADRKGDNGLGPG